MDTSEDDSALNTFGTLQEPHFLHPFLGDIRRFCRVKNLSPNASVQEDHVMVRQAFPGHIPTLEISYCQIITCGSF